MARVRQESYSAGSRGSRERHGWQTRRPERQRQHHRHQSDRGRADEKPGVSAEGVVDVAAGPRAEAHPERRDQEHGAVRASHHLLAEVFTRDERVERHHAAVRDPEQNCGARRTSRVEKSRCRVAAPPSATAPMSAGAFLTRSATGMTTSQARSPSTIIATRQSYAEVIQRVSGESRNMPAPPPAEMMPSARPRLLVNHFVAVAESGVRKAPAAKPTPKPNVTCRCQSAVAWLESTRLRPSKRPPAIVTN